MTRIEYVITPVHYARICVQKSQKQLEQAKQYARDGKPKFVPDHGIEQINAALKLLEIAAERLEKQDKSVLPLNWGDI